MASLVERLKKVPNSELRDLLSNSTRVNLNYEWWLRGSENFGYVEIDFGDKILRTKDDYKAIDQKGAEAILRRQSKSAMAYISEVSGKKISAKGYYFWKPLSTLEN